MDSFEGMKEGLYKARSGLIRVLLRVENGRIADIMVSGDFILSPERYIDEMEKALAGAGREEVLFILRKFYVENAFQSPQTYPEDFAQAVINALDKQ